MRKFRNELLNCEFSEARLPIEFKTIIYTACSFNNLRTCTNVVDFNGIKLFEEEDVKNEPDYLIKAADSCLANSAIKYEHNSFELKDQAINA